MRLPTSAQAVGVSRLRDQRTQVRFRFASVMRADVGSGSITAALIERLFGVFGGTIQLVHASAS